MKETLNVSINGVRFIINNDAYQLLRGYLDKIEAAYSNEAGGAEIIADIEARISELLLSKQHDEIKAVNRECVEYVISLMGEPEGKATDKSEPAKPAEHIQKRLYRKKEGAILGGVLNGLSAYFNVDVVVPRILFVLLFVLGCFFSENLVWGLIIGYFVMWIIVPRAKTALQKMEMRGKPVTASSIENSIKEEMNSVARSPKNEKAASLFTSILYVIGRIIKVFLVFIAAVFGVAILFSLLAVVVGVFLMFAYVPTIELFFGVNSFVFIPVLALSVIMPLLFIAYVIFKVLFNVKWSKGVIIALVAIWFVSWGALAVLAFYEFSGGRSSYRDIHTEEIKSSSSALYINDFDNFVLRGDGEIFQHVARFVKEDRTLPDSVYRIVIEKSATGGNTNSAKELAEQIDYSITVVSDSIVMMDPKILINRINRTFSGQSVSVTIYHPKDGQVIIASEGKKEDSESNLPEEVVE